MAVSALAVGGVALGAAPASAVVTPAECWGQYGDDALTVIGSSTGTVWYGVCTEDGTTADANTAHKTDAFDGLGYLYLHADTADEVQIIADGAPFVEKLGEDELRITFTDADVQWAPDDFVDIVVVKHIKGSTQRWTFTITDSDDGSPRDDVRVDFFGWTGSDGGVQFEFAGGALVGYGDDHDPLIALKATSDVEAMVGSTPATDQFWAFVVGSGSSITVGIVDYSCQNYEDAIDHTRSIAPTLDSLFGLTLAAPGTQGCLTAVSPIRLTTGADFDREIQVTFGPEMPLTEGGSMWPTYYDTDGFLDYEIDNFAVPGEAPTLRIFGTAPSEPGTYFLYVGGYSEASNLHDQAFIEIIVEPLQLAATGSTLSPLVIGSGIALLLAGTVTLVAVRRREVRA